MSELTEALRGMETYGYQSQLACSAADRIEKLEAALRWYADQMCEGLCQGKDPKACAAIGADNCAGCPAVVALTP